MSLSEKSYKSINYYLPSHNPELSQNGLSVGQSESFSHLPAIQQCVSSASHSVILKYL